MLVFYLVGGGEEEVTRTERGGRESASQREREREREQQEKELGH